MRIARDRLIFLGLVALDEEIRRCRAAPVVPSPALRVVLAMLYDLSGGRERWAFDEWWRVCQLAPTATLTEYKATYQRTTQLQALRNRICRLLDVEVSPEFQRLIVAARRPRESDHEALARVVREQGEARRAFKAHVRQKQQCTITS